jgi:hypothetical protein
MLYIKLNKQELINALEQETGERLTDIEFLTAQGKNEVIGAKLIIDRSNIKKQNNEKAS